MVNMYEFILAFISEFVYMNRYVCINCAEENKKKKWRWGQKISRTHGDLWDLTHGKARNMLGNNPEIKFQEMLHIHPEKVFLSLLTFLEFEQIIFFFFYLFFFILIYLQSCVTFVFTLFNYVDIKKKREIEPKNFFLEIYFIYMINKLCYINKTCSCYIGINHVNIK